MKLIEKLAHICARTRIPVKKNDAVAKMKLLQKYKGLVFTDIDDDVTYTISTEKMHWQRGRNGGWNVLAEPPAYDDTNDALLEPYQINADCLISLIQQTEQPPLLNIQIVEKDLDEDEAGGSNENV